jgi:hypothetical protein
MSFPLKYTAKTKKLSKTMVIVGIEPHTSDKLDNHLTDCAIANVTTTSLLSRCDCQTNSYILHINSRKLH